MEIGGEEVGFCRIPLQYGVVRPAGEGFLGLLGQERGEVPPQVIGLRHAGQVGVDDLTHQLEDRTAGQPKVELGLGLADQKLRDTAPEMDVINRAETSPMTIDV